MNFVDRRASSKMADEIIQTRKLFEHIGFCASFLASLGFALAVVGIGPGRLKETPFDY